MNPVQHHMLRRYAVSDCGGNRIFAGEKHRHIESEERFTGLVGADWGGIWAGGERVVAEKRLAEAVFHEEADDGAGDFFCCAKVMRIVTRSVPATAARALPRSSHRSTCVITAPPTPKLSDVIGASGGMGKR